MINIPIKGETTVFAKNQPEYQNLSIRDEPSGDGNVMVSEWSFTPVELLRLLKGAPIQLKIIGNQHPPVMLEVGEATKIKED